VFFFSLMCPSPLSLPLDALPQTLTRKLSYVFPDTYT
jgi:hypothetical protein